MSRIARRGPPLDLKPGPRESRRAGGEACGAGGATALIGAACWAQTTTTISGTVLTIPRTTASALPLPGVLVYATTGTVAPLPAGVQCLTYQNPANAAGYTKTAVDGTFTLTDVPDEHQLHGGDPVGKVAQAVCRAGRNPTGDGAELHMPADP